MRFVPITLKQANDFVEQHHRHSARTNNDGGKFAIAVEVGGVIVGVAILGRPVARLLHDEVTAEITRCCVSPDAPRGTPSALYQRCARIWQLMGGKRVVTYALKREGGESVDNLTMGVLDLYGPPRPGQWTKDADVAGNRQWDTPSRPRKHREIYEEPKNRISRLL